MRLQAHQLQRKLDLVRRNPDALLIRVECQELSLRKGVLQGEREGLPRLLQLCFPKQAHEPQELLEIQGVRLIHVHLGHQLLDLTQAGVDAHGSQQVHDLHGGNLPVFGKPVEHLEKLFGLLAGEAVPLLEVVHNVQVFFQVHSAILVSVHRVEEGLDGGAQRHVAHLLQQLLHLGAVQHAVLALVELLELPYVFADLGFLHPPGPRHKLPEGKALGLVLRPLVRGGQLPHGLCPPQDAAVGLGQLPGQLRRLRPEVEDQSRAEAELRDLLHPGGVVGKAAEGAVDLADLLVAEAIRLAVDQQKGQKLVEVQSA
mmetsp:Transcript_41567/g.99003  ORF Transcript_41567/g.99003 Transcript_41567/m.99003 type:complete len:314 (+) Transcript_41567:890-1831(+)